LLESSSGKGKKNWMDYPPAFSRDEKGGKEPTVSALFTEEGEKKRLYRLRVLNNRCGPGP